MSDKTVVTNAVAAYEVTFRDGTTKVFEAKRVDFGEYGVTFSGRRHAQGHSFVAFVPYGDLRAVEDRPEGKL
ncbi:hypothetical protein [Streptomyces seoulensis]|uniref:hypothetical protein n=1 Tax=Streptomyces seoulensis TaxID=73044 RepID=UPI001FCA9F86|nr:hypothetical protein [Streptomyces seoulensis]